MALVVAAGCLVAVGVVAAVLERRRRRRRCSAVFGAGHPPPDVTRELDLAALELAPPAPGRLLAVLFTGAHCAGCASVRERLGRLDAVDVVEYDAAVDPDPLRVVGIDRVPVLCLCDASGATVRSWVGVPLPGTLEDSARRALGQ